MKHKRIPSLFRRLFIILGVVFALIAFCACANSESTNRTIGGVYAVDVSTVYDGRPHSITIMNTLNNDTVSYSTDGVNYSSVNPAFVLPDEYTVYFKVNRSGYKELASSATVTISPCILSDISAQDVSVGYDGLPHSITIQGLQPLDSVTYSTDGLTFSSEQPSFTSVGDYTVYYSVERNYGYYKSSCALTIFPTVYGRYFNSAWGVVELFPHTATVNDDGYSGFIGDEPFSIKSGVLAYKDLSFTRLSDSDCVYKLTASDNSVFFCAGTSGKLNVSFENGVAVIKLEDNTLLSVPDYNYCESGVVTDYIDLCFEQAFEHTADITDITVTLSNREANPITFDCRYVTYDGKPHGFEFSQPVTYISKQTTFTDVGKHTVSVLIISNKYLPCVTDCTMVILPDISGTYSSSAHVIEISDGKVKIDGTECGELSATDDGWALNDKPITVTNNGIVYDGEAYAATTDTVLVVRLNGETYAVLRLPQNVDQLKAHYNGTTLSFTAENEELLNLPISCDSVTILLQGTPLPTLVPNETNTFVIGCADLDSDIVIVDVKTTENE